MTQREIARAVGLSEGSISHYVNGWRLPSAGNLYRLAGVLGVDVRSLT
ncbi:helix-turn-helix domain-containing protein [Pseudonocardia hydrocarbonoxydans]